MWLVPFVLTQVTAVRCYIEFRLIVCCCIASWNTPLGRTKWHWDRFFSEYFVFPLAVSFHRCFILTRSFVIALCNLGGRERLWITHIFLTVVVQSTCTVVRQGKLNWLSFIHSFFVLTIHSLERRITGHKSSPNPYCTQRSFYVSLLEFHTFLPAVH